MQNQQSSVQNTIQLPVFMLQLCAEIAVVKCRVLQKYLNLPIVRIPYMSEEDRKAFKEKHRAKYDIDRELTDIKYSTASVSEPFYTKSFRDIANGHHRFVPTGEVEISPMTFKEVMAQKYDIVYDELQIKDVIEKHWDQEHEKKRQLTPAQQLIQETSEMFRDTHGDNDLVIPEDAIEVDIEDINDCFLKIKVPIVELYTKIENGKIRYFYRPFK